MRLLTDTQIGDLIDLEKEFTYPCSDGSYTSTIDCREVAEAEHKETLKAVGSWVEKKRAGRTMADGKMALVKEIPDENWVCFLTDEDINALLRGEMPEEAK